MIKIIYGRTSIRFCNHNAQPIERGLLMAEDELAEIRRRKLEALMGQNEQNGVVKMSGVTEVKDSTFEEFSIFRGHL